jgi:bacteriochlorophyll 4-vinyl reductase
MPHEDFVVVNAIMRQAMVAAQEVMGQHGLNTVLRTSGLERYINNLPPDDLSPAVKSSDYGRLNEAIEVFYGRGARGMLRRIGKACFQYGLREQGSLFGLAGVAMKLLPVKQRIRIVLNSLLNALKKTSPEAQLLVVENGDLFAYEAHSCSVCYGRHTDKPACHLYAGTVAEAVEWATGQAYQVQETLCLAKGDACCRFEVGEPIS